MASLRNRITAAWNALVSGSPGLAEYAGTMVRPHEEGNRLRRYTQTTAEQLARRFVGYVKTCQSMNANGVAGAKLGVYRRKNSGKKSSFEARPVSRKELLRQRKSPGPITRKAAEMSDEVEEIIDPFHPLVALLQTANPLMNGFGLLEQTQYGIGLAGNAYWHTIAGPDGLPAELWPIPPQFIRPLPSRDVVISEYIYGRGTEVERTIPAAEIVRFSQFNASGDPYRGSGDLEACLEAADLMIAFNQFRLATLDNGAQPGGFVIAKNMVGEVPRQQLEEQINRKYAGISKAGRVVVLTGDVDWKPGAMGDGEMKFLASEDQVRETIANCHDIPIILLTMRDSGALAAARAAREGWQERGLKPRCNRIADTINQNLVPMFEVDPRLRAGDLYVCFEEVVQRDMEAAAVRVRTLYTGDDKSIITLNEARAELDYDALPDGDTIPEPAPAPAPAIGAGQTDNPPGSPGDPAKPAEPAAKALRPAAKGLCPDHTHTWSQVDMLVKGPACECCSRHPSIMRKDASMDAVEHQERVSEAVLRNWFLEVAPLLMRGLQTTQSATPTLVFNMPSGIAVSLEAALKPIIEAAAKQGYNFGVLELGPAAGPAQIQAALTKPVEDFLRKYTGETIKSVTETIERAIRQTLADGIAQGESIPELTARVQQLTGSDMPRYGAERIARTETARAFMAAREQAWIKSGTVARKKWLLAPDACAFCREIAKKFPDGIPLGDSFFKKGDTLELSDGSTMNLDYADVMGPALHPNCRCSLVSVPQEPQK